MHPHFRFVPFCGPVLLGSQIEQCNRIRQEYPMKRILAALILIVCSRVYAQNTPAFVQSNVTGAYSTGNVVAFSSNVTAGHALYAMVFDGNGSGDTLAFSDSQGNSWATTASANVATGFTTLAIGCAIAGSSGSDTVSISVNGSAAVVGIVAYEFSNATCTPDVTPVSSDRTSQTACSSGPLTTTAANDLLIGFCGVPNFEPSFSAGNGWSDTTQITYQTYGALAIGEAQIASSAGAYTATSQTFASSNDEATIEVAFKATTSGGGGTQGGVTGSGTANAIAMFTGSSSIGNSPISATSSGNIGIGTTNPGMTLDVNGGVQTSAPNSGFGIMTLGDRNANPGNKGWLLRGEGDANPYVGNPDSLDFEFWNGTTVSFPLTLGSNGDIGIGTTTPGSPLTVAYSNNSFGSGIDIQNTNPGVDSLTGIGFFNTSGVAVGGLNYTPINFANGAFADTLALGTTTNTANIMLATNTPYLPGASGNISLTVGQRPASVFVQGSSGNVGIGTTNPQAKLEISGSLRFTADGSVQSTAWTGVLCGGDYAEAVDAKGSRKSYEPGDVLVIGDGAEGEVQKSAEPYSTMVAGIFATKPGVIGRRQSLLKDGAEIPMAMVGIVPTKVTTENGPIHRGDLLVTSSTQGYAMKGTDRSRLVGAVIGKAMGSLETGDGAIEVLVTLQ
jgi:hypothetical protein